LLRSLLVDKAFVNVILLPLQGKHDE
jgi:hypothetical protein